MLLSLDCLKLQKTSQVMQSLAWLLRNFVKEFPNDKFKLWESLPENLDSIEQVAGCVDRILNECPKINNQIETMPFMHQTKLLPISLIFGILHLTKHSASTLVPNKSDIFSTSMFNTCEQHSSDSDSLC